MVVELGALLRPEVLGTGRTVLCLAREELSVASLTLRLTIRPRHCKQFTALNMLVKVLKMK